MKELHGRVLLVDDDPGLLKLLSYRLRSAGFEVKAVDSGRGALDALDTFNPRLVISDLRMDEMDGMALFDSIHSQRPALPVIILTAHGTIPDAVDATRRGLFGFLTKPFDSDQLLDCVRRAVSLNSSAADAYSSDEWQKDIVTRSPQMLALLERAKLAARTPTPVFIHGESGTGKELLASAIHNASDRKDRPFVPINCTAIPENLLESELFGHTKGSFTGATESRGGLFRAANGGTLFFDEIGDMSMAFQGKLLRALQEKEIRPVGSTKSVPVDVRIISATHRDLDAAVAAGEFREDLYYRLKVVDLELPPLSQRREDIALLAAHFLDRIRQSYETPVTGFAPKAMETLLEASWPGNVRQLQNVVEQTAALSTTPVIPQTLVQAALHEEDIGFTTLTEARGRFERQYLVRLLRATHGNVSRAARLAGRDRSKFYQLLRRHHLDPAQFRE
jgi:two-component system response regulator GlrR